MDKKKCTGDPGHGGKDPGAIGPTGVQEKVVNLSVARKVAVLLQPVMSVILTRDTDKALGANLSADLSTRASMANQSGADVFVSIHCNSAADERAHGTEAHNYPGCVQGKKLARCIQSRLVPALGLTDRGVKESNFAVLRQTNCPAALVELAFISNSVEEKLLQSDEFQDKAAKAIAQGICDFLGVELPVPAPVVAQTGPEQWKIDIMEQAKKVGLIAGDHNPDELAPKWFVCKVALNTLKESALV